jgi:hypothetical protein
MKYATMLLVLTGLVVGLLVSCGRYAGDKVEDVTSDKTYWGGYEVGLEYATTCDLLFDGYEFGKYFYWPLNAPVRRRIDFEQYKNNPADYSGVIEVPAGTRFKIVRIQKRYSFEYNALEMYARFLDGPNPGAEFSVLGISYSKGGGEWLGFFPSDAVKKNGP